jgi:TP901 family phage tail tape measure protein
MSLNGSLGLGVVLEAKDMASGAIDHFGASLKRAHGLSKEAAAGITSDLKSLALGGTIMAAGIGGLVALGPALDESNAFGKSIKLVATEVDAATFSQSAMKRETRDLAGTFGILPVAEAKALYKAVALGANDAAKSTALMTATNELAVAGDADLSVTMDALGGSLNAYHLQAGDASMVSDAFFTAMKNGNTTVGDLAASVGRVGAGAHEMGITVQETLGAISVMTNKGIQASEAVSYLHGALANIVHPAKEARSEAARLGIQFNAEAVRSKGFVGFLRSITENSKFSKDSINKLFHSVEGSQAMAMLAGDMKAVDDVMVEMKNSTGATAKGFALMSDGAGFQIKRFEALKATALGLIGEALSPIQGAFYKVVNTALDGFNKLSPSTQAFIVKGFALAATIATIVGGVIALKASIGILSVGMSLAGVTFAGTFLPIVVAVGAATAAVAAFRVAYERDLGGFRTFVDGTVAKAQLAWAALGQVFEDGGFSGSVMADLNKADNQGVKNFVISVFVAANRIKNFFEGIGTGFSDGIERAKPAFEAFMGALDRLGTALGITSVDTEANGKKFDEYGKAGKAVGEALAWVAEKALYLTSAFIDVVTWLSSFAAWVGSSQLAMDLLRDAVVAFAAVKVANVAVSIVSGIASIGRAATVANIPLLAFTAAIASLLVAYDQWKKLMAEWDEGSWSRIGKKLKADLGITSQAEIDAEYDKKGRDAFRAAQNANGKGISTPASGAIPPPPLPEPGPLVSAVQAEGQMSASVSDESFMRLADAVQKAPPVQVDASSSVYIDGDEIKSWAQNQSVGDGVRRGIPMSSQQ